jgi:predicted dehydrogenase
LPEGSTICVVGYGSIGARHARNAGALGAKVFFLRSKAEVVDAVRLSGEIDCVFDSEEAVARRPDLAVIALPTHLHIGAALPFAKAGIPLLIEKPLSHTLTDLAQLEDILSQRRSGCYVGYMMRFDPSILALRSVIMSGELGPIHGAFVEWSTYLPNWHPWEDYRQSYAARSDMGGGVVLTCSHEIDLARFLFGECERIFATGGRITGLEIDADDCVSMLLHHRAGIASHLHLTYAHRPAHRAIRVIGENGAAEWDFFRGCAEVIGSNGNRREVGRRPDDFNQVYVEELKAVLKAVHAREPDGSVISYREGRRTLDLCMAILKSLGTRSVIDINEGAPACS